MKDSETRRYNFLSLNHYVDISYQVKFGDGGMVEYDRLEGKYIEQPISAGMRGSMKRGEPRIVVFSAAGTFASAKPLILTAEEAASRFCLLMGFGRLGSEYPEVFSIPVLPPHLVGVTFNAAGWRRDDQSLVKYLASTLSVNYSVDILRAAGLVKSLDFVKEGYLSKKDFVRKLVGIMQSRRFEPKVVSELPKTGGLVHLVSVEVGGYVREAIYKVMQEPVCIRCNIRMKKFSRFEDRSTRVRGWECGRCGHIIVENSKDINLA